MSVLNIIIYSGGMDSFTVLHHVLNTQPDYHIDSLKALSFYYGQTHSKELRYAKAECERLGIEHKLIDLSGIAGALFSGSALTSGPAVPEGHYEAETMRQTVVPGRNTVMLSMALAYAEAQMLTYPTRWTNALIWYGAHSGDHHIYPDCRPEFVRAMKDTISAASGGLIQLEVPYLHGNKESILLEGRKLWLDYSKTWTCYKGGEVACGKCGSCQERLSAFAALDERDPLEYASRELIEKS